MASITEIRGRMRSIEQTLKITNAMYLISSAKVKKARKQLSEVEPYFDQGIFPNSFHNSSIVSSFNT